MTTDRDLERNFSRRAAAWAAVFKMSTWVQPITQTRSIYFTYDGKKLVEVARTPAGVPN